MKGMHMSKTDQEELFFPRQRKKMMVRSGGTGPLKEGTTRMIRLGLRMNLDDGKLTGMPSYIGDVYNALAKADSLMNSPNIEIELSGIKVQFFTTENTADASIEVDGCNLTKFRLFRASAKRDGEAPPIYLDFSLRTNGWVPALWTWLGDNYGAEFWMGFNSSQMSLVFIGQAPEEEEEETPAADLAQTPERKAAKGPESDALFGIKAPAEKPKSHARKKAEDALSGKGPVLIH